MILKKREKILAIFTVGLLALVVLYQVYTRLRGSQGGLEAQRANAAAELERINTRLANASRVQKRMNEWAERSLPSDSRTAQSLYQNWLLQLARNARFSDTKIDAAQRRRRGDVFYALQFNFQAKTTLEGLTWFLYDFYKADHLHQIVNMTISPEGNGELLKVQMTFEALSLTAAKSKSELSSAISERPLETEAVYDEEIIGRNLFAAYQPPPPPEPPAQPAPPEPERPRFDPVKFAYLTGLTATGDRPKAWIIARTTGDRYELSEGELFEIGESRCKVLQIGERDAEFEIDGERRRVALGKSLREGEKLSANDRPAD